MFLNRILDCKGAWNKSNFACWRIEELLFCVRETWNLKHINRKGTSLHILERVWNSFCMLRRIRRNYSSNRQPVFTELKYAKIPSHKSNFIISNLSRKWKIIRDRIETKFNSQIKFNLFSSTCRYFFVENWSKIRELYKDFGVCEIRLY